MINVKLIESVRQIKNEIEVIATVKDKDEEFLGITNFILLNMENIPEDEDDLSYYLQNKELTWNIYLPKD